MVAPAASSDAIFALALGSPEMVNAPACPMIRPGASATPAIRATTGLQPRSQPYPESHDEATWTYLGESVRE